MVTLRSVLCPIDFSDQSRDALQWALALAAQHHSRLTVFTSVEPLLAEAVKARFDMDLVESDTKPALEHFVKTALPEPVACSPETAFQVGVGKASELILEAAAREHADVIVMGTHGLGGFRKLLLGSTTERVLRRTRTAVLAVPRVKTHAVVLGKSGPRLELKSILVGTDFSEASAAAVRWAVDVAEQLHVPVVLSHVVTPIVVPSRWQSDVADIEEERYRCARTRLTALSATVKKGGPCDSVVAIGRPAESLAATAEERDAGLIVVGLMGEEGGRTVRPGSIAYRLLCLAHVPVLVVPPSS
jgi:nucleotide-binding universal stress UspA family protein